MKRHKGTCLFKKVQTNFSLFIGKDTRADIHKDYFCKVLKMFNFTICTHLVLQNVQKIIRIF